MKKWFLFLATLLYVELALANAGWPAAWVMAGAGAAVTHFYLLIIASLIIEGVVLWKLSQMSWKKAALITVLANGFSAAAGVGLMLPMMYSDGFLHKYIVESGVGMYCVDLVIIFVITVAIETGIVRIFWRAPLKRIIFITSISNIVTHALGVLYVYSR